MHEVFCNYLQASKIQMQQESKNKQKNVDTILDEFLSQNEQMKERWIKWQHNMT